MQASVYLFIDRFVTLSNISNSLALGWWMVQMMVLPPSARERISETTW